MSDNKVFSYTKRDFEGSRKEGLSKIPAMSNGTWTDLNATDPGIIMLDYVHSLVDMIQYYQDHQALEAFITTAKERSNIFRLAEQLSYKIRSAKSARVVVTFRTTLIHNEDLKIPKNTVVHTGYTSIKYITTEDAVIKAGEYSVSVECVQGELYTKEYKGTGTSRYSTDVEFPENQYISLTSDNIDTEFISVVDNLGRTWTPVDSIIFSESSDRVYQIVLNPDNSVTIKFGDGERGVIPQETDTLTVTYLVSDAEDGRVTAHSLTYVDSYAYLSNGDDVELYADNAEDSTGGYSAQSSSSIRDLAPGAIKAQDRAVTLSDFENLAKSVEGIRDAKAYDVNLDPDIPYHVVKVVVVPEEYSDSTESILVSRVENYLSKRMIPPTNLQVTLPSLIDIDLKVVVKSFTTDTTGYLENLIKNTVSNYFEELSHDIGESFYPSDLAARISSIDNVRYVVSMDPSAPVEIANTAAARLNTLNLEIQ